MLHSRQDWLRKQEDKDTQNLLYLPCPQKDVRDPGTSFDLLRSSCGHRHVQFGQPLFLLVVFISYVPRFIMLCSLSTSSKDSLQQHNTTRSARRGEEAGCFFKNKKTKRVTPVCVGGRECKKAAVTVAENTHSEQNNYPRVSDAPSAFARHLDLGS